jgi:hypothetical protein
MIVGPIQYVAFEFAPGTAFEGEIVAELDRLYARGTIRVLDLMVVRRGEDGELTSVRAAGLSLRDLVETGEVVRNMLGIAPDKKVVAQVVEMVRPELVDDVTAGIVQTDLEPFLADLAPGATVLVVLLEHVWATRVAALVHAMGGTTLTQGLLTPEMRAAHGATLESASEVAAMTELAAALEGADYLDALRSLDPLHHVQSVVAAETVRALIVAGLMPDEAAEHALVALSEAGLLSEEALAAADAAVAASAAELAAAGAVTNDE